MNTEAPSAKPAPWNKGKMTGQEAPLKLREIWAIRVRLQLGDKKRDLALFNLAIDSKLRACDLIRLRVSDIAHGIRVSSRAIVVQKKTGRPVQFEITEQARDSVMAWMSVAGQERPLIRLKNRVPEVGRSGRDSGVAEICQFGVGVGAPVQEYSHQRSRIG